MKENSTTMKEALDFISKLANTILDQEGVLVTILFLLLAFACVVIYNLIKRILERERDEVSRIAESNAELRIENAILKGFTKENLEIMFPGRWVTKVKQEEIEQK